MSRFALAASAATMLFVAAPSMAATALFDLGVADPSAGLGSGVFGTVSVTESGGSLIFTQTLNSGYRIHETRNNKHNAFTFSLLGDPAISISDLTSGFTFNSSSASAPPFGAFDYGISCVRPNCGPGWGGGYADPLTFKVTANSGTLSLASLVFNTNGGQDIYFTTDLVNPAGKTGNVGATLHATTAVPEPASWAMFIGGFGLIGGALRRRKRMVASVA